MSIDAATLADHLGPSAVGRSITSPWFPGAHEINQGWGPSDYDGEPEGHGYQHWHAGVDIGLPCGTDIHMPPGLFGKAVWIDNPGGYGTALRIELSQSVPAPVPGGRVTNRTFDVWLGHLRQRLVKSGEQVAPGDHLAISNNTGNSTGCHLHFEVRPNGAKYGTDVDPTTLLLAPTGDASQPPSSNGNPYPDWDPRHGIWDLENQVTQGINRGEQLLLGVGQAGLGTVLLLSGLAIVAYGVRGKDLGVLRRDALSLATRPSRARPATPAGPRVEEGAGAEPSGSEAVRQARISRVRKTHQGELLKRQAGADLTPEAQAAVHAARHGRGTKLSPKVKAELRGRPRFQPSPSR